MKKLNQRGALDMILIIFLFFALIIGVTAYVVLGSVEDDIDQASANTESSSNSIADTVIEEDFQRGLGPSNEELDDQEARALDDKYKIAINVMSIELEKFYNDNGFYPTLEEIKDEQWISSNFGDSVATDLSAIMFFEPQVNSTVKVEVTPEGCVSELGANDCQDFRLFFSTWTDGTVFSKSGLN